jgi:hypothetical protein
MKKDITELGEWAGSRETSVEVAEAIYSIAVDDTDASRIWDAPADYEITAIWERATKNGLIHDERFLWGGATLREIIEVRTCFAELAVIFSTQLDALGPRKGDTSAIVRAIQDAANKDNQR